MIDYILYHDFIKPFYQKYKIQLDFPARPSGSGIHPSHKISNKRRMRGRGLDTEQEDEDFLLKKSSQDADKSHKILNHSSAHRKEPNFGKYVVNLNLLSKGILAIRKPSGAHF